MEAEQSVATPSHKTRNADSHQQLKEEKDKIFPSSLCRVQPCQHTDHLFLASRPVREYISVVLNHQVCCNLLWATTGN